MITSVLIPTIKGRENFVNQAKALLNEQTVKPTFIEIIDDEPIYDGVDVAWRYKIGIERCKKNGADVIIFWEDDDWYRYDYIELMLKHWTLSGQPDIFGVQKTIYYNIVKRMFLPINHPGRASMMQTMVTKKFVPDWEAQRDPYVDMYLWKSMVYSKGVIDVPFEDSIAIGIKHGIGLTAGGGHKWNAERFKYQDFDLKFLSSIVDKDSLNFYASFYENRR